MLLGVNIDHVATLRNARGGVEPSPILAAEICENNGATSITTHLREDRRHIKDEDVRTLIKRLFLNQYKPMNIIQFVHFGYNLLIYIKET